MHMCNRGATGLRRHVRFVPDSGGGAVGTNPMNATATPAPQSAPTSAPAAAAPATGLIITGKRPYEAETEQAYLRATIALIRAERAHAVALRRLMSARRVARDSRRALARFHASEEGRK
jgi:hypothetical protein